ncbi:MAG TPA: GntR family transcriptional regulator [Actinokineospora sp.]|nr:GntR family transcriptional regulator [Actinokineospora sp.]
MIAMNRAGQVSAHPRDDLLAADCRGLPTGGSASAHRCRSAIVLGTHRGGEGDVGRTQGRRSDGQDLPKYFVIQRDLLRRIGTGEFRVGAALPSQRALSEEYGVSLMTFRHALRSLEEQGVVEQISGSGTFVRAQRERVEYRGSGLTSIVADLQDQGIAMDTAIVSIRMTVPSEEVAALLGRPDANDVLQVERLRLVDSRPVAWQVSTIPEPYATALRDVDFSDRSLYRLLAEECQASPVKATETIVPIVFDDDLAGALDVPKGELGLRTDRTTFDSEGVPLVHDRAWLVSSRMVVTLERQAAGPDLQYRLKDRPSDPQTA